MCLGNAPYPLHVFFYSHFRNLLVVNLVPKARNNYGSLGLTSLSLPFFVAFSTILKMTLQLGPNVSHIVLTSTLSFIRLSLWLMKNIRQMIRNDITNMTREQPPLLNYLCLTDSWRNCVYGMIISYGNFPSTQTEVFTSLSCLI